MVEDKYYLFDFYKYILFEIEPITYEIVEKLQNGVSFELLKNVYGKEKVDSVYNRLEYCFKHNVFSSSEEDKCVPFQYEKAYFSFPTVHSCNMRCKYCFAMHGENYKAENRDMTEETVKKIMQFIYFDVFKDCSKYRLDMVSGGEPLLNFNVLKTVLRFSKEQFKNTGKKLQIFLCTNGTINNKEFWDFMNENNISLGVSIDGNRKNHNLARVDSENKGTYDTVCTTIKSIIDNNSYNGSFKDIWGLSVITGKTDSIRDIIDHNKALGIKRMQMKFARLTKDNELSINEYNVENVKKMYKELIAEIKKNSYKHEYTSLKMILNNTDYLGKLIVRIILGQKVIYRCYTGKNKLSFDAEGNIYPCDSFVGNKDFLLGNIEQGIDNNKRERFFRASIFEREKCTQCWAKYICGGDCYHNSYLSNGDILQPDKIYCDLMKALIEQVLDMVNTIRRNGDLNYFRSYLRIKVSLEEN